MPHLLAYDAKDIKLFQERSLAGRNLVRIIVVDPGPWHDAAGTEEILDYMVFELR